MKKPKRPLDESQDSVKVILRADAVYKRAKRALENSLEGMDVDRVTQELFSLHASRAVSALKPAKILQSRAATLIDSSVQEIAVRSRITTIQMTTLRSLLTLEEIIDPLRKYVMHTYGNAMKLEGHSTLAAQKASVDTYLKLFINRKRKLDYILKISDLVLADVDSAGWSLKRIQETLETLTRER